VNGLAKSKAKTPLENNLARSLKKTKLKEKANAQVNRRPCEAWVSALNRQLEQLT
jgi:hypothetical protein